MITDYNIERFLAFVNSYDAFVVAGHKDPDGDCLSSSFVIASLLKHLQKKVQLVSAGPFKRAEIKQYEKLFKKEPTANSWFSPNLAETEKAALIIVDCSELSRLGDLDSSLRSLPTFIIDHHKTSECNDEVSIVDASSPATVYIIQQLYEHIVGDIPADIAKFLFFGLSTDTGYFRFLNEKDGEVFRAAGRLIDKGVNPREAYNEMTGGRSFLSRKLLAVLLDRAELHYNNRLVLTYETLDDTKKLGYEGRDSDALYSLLLAVENVHVVVIVRQESDKNCTVGLRSKGDIDVSAIAASYGGGGHKNAAGLTVEMKLGKCIDSVLSKFSGIL